MFWGKKISNIWHRMQFGRKFESSLWLTAKATERISKLENAYRWKTCPQYARFRRRGVPCTGNQSLSWYFEGWNTLCHVTDSWRQSPHRWLDESRWRRHQHQLNDVIEIATVIKVVEIWSTYIIVWYPCESGWWRHISQSHDVTASKVSVSGTYLRRQWPMRRWKMNFSAIMFLVRRHFDMTSSWPNSLPSSFSRSEL